MLDCSHVEREEMAERYLRGALSPAEAETYEEHYFSCERCFAELQSCRALRAELLAESERIRAETPARRFPWGWTVAFSVAAALLAVVLWQREPGPAPQPGPPAAGVPAVKSGTPSEKAPPKVQPQPPSLAALAQFDPPVYVPVTLRSGADEAAQHFRAAMEDYVKKDYAAAIPGLEAAAKLNPQAASIRFYLGICRLLTNQTGAAVSDLQATIALGDTPYLEEAHFYLAKAFLKRGNLESARTQLTSVIQLDGKLKDIARALLAQVDTLRATPR